MKSMTLHPLSVLVGVVLAGLSLVLTGAAQSSRGVQHLPRTEVRLVDEIPAEWWTHVLLSSTPYVVPGDQHLVVTSFENSGGGDVHANGVSCFQKLRPARIAIEDTHGTRVVFEPGTVLTAPNSAASLWGYLEPVR